MKKLCLIQEIVQIVQPAEVVNKHQMLTLQPYFV